MEGGGEAFQGFQQAMARGGDVKAHESASFNTEHLSVVERETGVIDEKVG